MLAFVAALPAQCSEIVSITDKGDHYSVLIDYKDASPKNVGESYGRAIRAKVPQFESLWDSYIKEYGSNWFVYKIVLRRVRQMRKQLLPAYRAEIDGMASQLSGGNKNKAGDGKVSRDELYLLNVIGDVCRMNQCCAISVFGERTKDGQTICGRNLDWPDGKKHQLAQLQAAITCNNGNKSFVSIACIGFQGVATGFNTKGVFAGVLDSGTGSKYTAKRRRSYLFDLREALETSDSVHGVADLMMEKKRKYAFNHLVILADKQGASVLENNFSGKGEHLRRALRQYDSELNPGITWGIKDSIGAVNCFALKGNCDNHIDPLDWSAYKKGNTERDINTPRWRSLKARLLLFNDKVDSDGVKSILSFYHPESRGNIYRGDLYNSFTLQSVVFKPATLELDVGFRPKDGHMPTKPLFQRIDTGLLPVLSGTMAGEEPPTDDHQEQHND